MSIKKTRLMSLQQLKQDQHRKALKGQNVNQDDIDIIIRKQKIAMTDSFTYLVCTVTNDQRHDAEISTRLAKAAKAFNMLLHAVWHKKGVSIIARLRIFRACVIPGLMYASEIWALTIKQEQRIASFYYKFLRTIIGISLGDRVSDEKLLNTAGQPTVENVIRRNRLRWFGHVNRCVNVNGCPSVVKKTMFAYFHREKRPTNMGRTKRWEDKVLKDIEELNIRNWRKPTLNRDVWRKAINRNVCVKPIYINLKNIIYEYKLRAAQRRKDEVAVETGRIKRKITEILVKENNCYKCPGCMTNFKSQGNTNHVKACFNAKRWCKENKTN